MDELDSEKVGRTGVDPSTGSILSQEVRNALLKKSTIDASVFQNRLLAVENKRKEDEEQSVRLSQGQEQAFLGFNSSLQGLRVDIAKLGTGLSTIALLLQQDAVEDQTQIRQDQEKQRLLTERQVRVGRESEIEQKIQNAIAEPVQRLVPQVNDIFGKIGTALGILFGGWLTNQVVQAIKASEEGNTKLFNDVKFNIIKNLGIVGGGLLAIRAGFALIKRTIGGIASGLTKLLIAKPLAIAAALIPGLGGGKTPPKPGATPPRSGGGGIGGKIGRFITFLSGLMNLKNKEYVDATLSALSLAARAPGALGAIGKIAGIAFTADEIAEAFGKNIFGNSEKDNLINEIAQKFKNKPESKPVSSKVNLNITTTNKPTDTQPQVTKPEVVPQETMMGTQPPSPDMTKKFEMAWQYRNNPMARGRIEDDWNKMNPEQQQQAKTWAQSKGYDWNEMRLKDAVDMSDLKQQPSKTEEAKITSAQVSIPPKAPQQVGQLPEPKPSLMMIKTSNNAPQQQNAPLTNGALTDVPLINSANPDNFYVLYSQLNYNVVI
jgi:hypothetical protein